MTSLIHYGILGMRWGVRRASTNHSADHKAYSEIKKKKIKDMSDDELQAVTKRVQLVSRYKEARLPRENRKKKISELSNAELEAGIRRGQLMKEDWTIGVRKMKKIKQMSDEEVAATLKRHYLEKPYRKIKREEAEATAKIVTQLVFGAARLASASSKLSQ